MKKATAPVMGKAGSKMSFGKVTKGSQKFSSNPKKVKFNVAQFHAKKGNVTN